MNKKFYSLLKQLRPQKDKKWLFSGDFKKHVMAYRAVKLSAML